MIVCSNDDATRAFKIAAEMKPDLKSRLEHIAHDKSEVHITVNAMRMNIEGQMTIPMAATIKCGTDVIVGMSTPVRPPVGHTMEAAMRNMRTSAALQALEKLRV